MRVFKHILSPLLLFISKFSKDVSKEPKEQLVIRAATEFRMKPMFHIHDQCVVKEVESRQLIVVNDEVDEETGEPLY